MKSRGRFNANKWSKHLRDLRDERCKDKRTWNLEHLHLSGDYGEVGGMLVNPRPTHQETREYLCGVYKTDDCYDGVGKGLVNTTTSFKGYRLEYEESLKRGTFLEECKAVLKFLFGKGN